MGIAGKRLLSIDWDRRNLRLVLVRPRADGVDLLKAVSVPIPPEVAMDEATSLGAFLREAMRQARVSARRALISIPRDQVVLNTLSLPASPAEELPSIVRFQIVKELPFAVEQATLDFAVAGVFDPSQACSVLVAAVRDEQADFYRKVAREAGLTIERLGLRPHANLIAVLAKAPELEDKSLFVVEVGPQLTEIDIIRGGVLAFSRAASVTLSDLPAGRGDLLQDSRISAAPVQDRQPDEKTRQAVSELMVEVVRSFEAYRATEPDIRLDRIIVCGATGVEPVLSEALAGRFAVPAGLYTPDRALSLTPQRARELRGFSAALGLAIGHGGRGLAHFDFLHPKRPVSRRSIRMKKAPAAVLTAALVIAAGCTFYFKQIKPLKDEAGPIESSVDAKKEKAESLKEFKNQVESVEDWIKSEQHWPEILVALTEVFPPEEEAFVTRLDFETKKAGKKSTIRPSSMRMKLRTSGIAKVNELSAKLSDLGYEDVRVGKEVPIPRRRGGMTYARDTSIQAMLPLRTRPEALPVSEEPDVPVDAPSGEDAAARAAGDGADPRADDESGPSAAAEPPPPQAGRSADEDEDAAKERAGDKAGEDTDKAGEPGASEASGDKAVTPKSRPGAKRRRAASRRPSGKPAGAGRTAP